MLSNEQESGHELSDMLVIKQITDTTTSYTQKGCSCETLYESKNKIDGFTYMSETSSLRRMETYQHLERRRPGKKTQRKESKRHSIQDCVRRIQITGLIAMVQYQVLQHIG